MKLFALIFTLLLGTNVLVQAQAPAADIQVAPSPAKESKPAPAKAPDPSALDGSVSFIQALPSPNTRKSKPGTKDPNMDPDGSVTLSAGRLDLVVAEIERRIPYWTPKPDSGDWVMPNVLYSPDVWDARVLGTLTLRAVSPLQALTLAAAAAGCAIEPIVATKEESDAADKPQSIIGYRIVPERKRGGGGGGGGGSIQSGFFNQSAQPSVKESQPKMKAPDPIKSVSGDVTFTGSDEDARNATNKKYLAARSFDDAMSVAQKDGNQRSVRIYALGSILSGTKEEIVLKQDHLRALVNEAMQKSEPEADGSISTGRGGSAISQKLAALDRAKAALEGGAKAGPELSFHLELRALIVKGTAEQHEIIEQVMKVLKENDLQEAAQPRR